ncbi:MAG: hypothetical protein HQM09_21880 [Candidatus Riflebacteria bacterium]|nr:hypothetical protein [Candidatus Riflebacteria bacterium]
MTNALKSEFPVSRLLPEDERRKDGSKHGFTKTPESLPYLAQICKSQWPDNFNFDIPISLDADKSNLKDAGGVPQDNVRTVALKTGVLVRDGGHFEAIFKSMEDAAEFVEKTGDLIARKLPGLLFDIRLKKLEWHQDKYCLKETGRSLRETEEKTIAGFGEQILDLPQFEDCEVTGMEPASEWSEFNEKGVSIKRAIGITTHEKHGASERFRNGKSFDVLGFLREPLKRGFIAGDGNSSDLFPRDFEALAKKDDGYLAVIVADGNNVGSRIRGIARDDFFEGWSRREEIFHSIRTGVRKAFTESLIKVFKGDLEASQKHRNFSFQPLMLGGDDLLMVCGASKALPFAGEFAEQVAIQTKEIPQGSLTIGVGVAIVKDSFPFFRAHSLAEQLAVSAKYLKLVHPGRSYVDWLVISESWHDDLKHIRAKDSKLEIGESTILLTGKPYVIKDDQQGSGKTLDNLLSDAARLVPVDADNSKTVARSQLKRLVGEIAEGEHSGNFAFLKLPKEQKNELQNYVVEGKPWEKAGPFKLTRLRDLSEVMELTALRAAPRE